MSADWRKLLNARSGSRFTEYYERRHRARTGKPGAGVSVLGGILLVLLGLALGPTPSPGFLFVLLGAALLAARSRALARALDRYEVRLRTFARRLRKPRG